MIEVIRDSQIRLAPINIAAPHQMITDLSEANLLGRFRGMQEADLNAVSRIPLELPISYPIEI